MTVNESAGHETSSRPGFIRVGVVCDYLEEGWLSMDLVAEMILDHLRLGHTSTVTAEAVRPPFRRRFAPLAPARLGGPAHNADRVLNRYVDYPRVLNRLARRGDFDLFHLVDHSYAQLVHALPADRTIVTCHDLDTFRCLLHPDLEPRPAWFRSLTRRTLSGLGKAAAVACDSEATRRAILEADLVPESRLHVVHLAVHPECSPDPAPEADAAAARLLGPAEGPEILHVGTNIERKRIDVLLGAFAEIRRALPEARLIKVGGAFPAGLARRAEALGIADAVVTLPLFSPREGRARATLAAVYRRASLVLLPSDAEGFGMPVAEAMASGTLVLASDIPVLREVGGDAATYAPVGDIPAWSEAALALLDERLHHPERWEARRRAGLDWASRYRWTTHVERLVEIYRSVLGRPRPA